MVPNNVFASARTDVILDYGDEAIVIKNNTLVPLTSVFKTFNASVQVEKDKTIKVSKGQATATITLNSKIIWINGKKTSFPTTQVIINKTMVPLKFAASFLNTKYTVDKPFRKLYMVDSDIKLEMPYNDVYELSKQYEGKQAWVATLNGILEYYSGKSVSSSAYQEFNESENRRDY